MTLLIAGWFQTTWFPDSWWQQDWWLEYGYVAPPVTPPGVAPTFRPKKKRRRLSHSTLSLLRSYLELKLGEENE